MAFLSLKLGTFREREGERSLNYLSLRGEERQVGQGN